METYLEKKASRFLEGTPTEAELTDAEAQKEDRWDSNTSHVALDELISIFRRRGLATKNSVMLPIHEPGNPSLTGEFVSYRNDEYGRSLLYRSADNDISEYINYSDAARSGLAYRLRFWDRRFQNPDNVLEELIDDRPPYRPDPVVADSPMSDDEYSDFVSDTLGFVRTELLAQHTENVDSFVKRGTGASRSQEGAVDSERIRVSAGRVICEVYLPPSRSHYHAHKRVEDVHGVYEGNTVVLVWETPDGKVEFLDGIVESIKGISIEIDIRFGVRNQNDVDLSRVDQVTVRVVEKGVAEQREYNAFEQLAEHSKSLLCGKSEIEFSSPLDLEFEPELDLNTYQERAAVSALCADDVFCIHGPPGTGKTRTLVAIVEQAVKSNETVLVCAHSNQAVDNIVAGESTKSEADAASIHRIVQRFSTEEDLEDISLVRLSSSPREVDSFVVSQYFLSTNHLESNIGDADVIASTTNTAAVLDDCDEVDIDLVVIDEATQASGPATAVPFGWGKRIEETEEGWPSRSYGHRTILAGDHRQLPPFVSDPEMRDQGLHTSLFERLLKVYGGDLVQTLYRQYRMHEDIATFASEEFYDGQLEHGEQNRTETITGLSPLLAIDDDSGDRQKKDSYSYYNPTEARYVVAQVQKALNKGVDPDDIGVITGYSDQREEIKSELNKTITDVEYNTIDVETIDKFQGGQREVIIVSFTRSNSSNDSGFFESPPEVGRKRLNVALTRAKKRLVLIGDWNTLSTPASFRDGSDSCADTFARLEEYLRENDCMISNK